VEPRTVEALNRAYPDSLLLVGRVLGDRPSATDARVVQADARGLDLGVGHNGRRSVVRVDFPAPAPSARAFGAAVLELVATARRVCGEPGETSAERELARLRSVRIFEAAVAEVDDVHPRLRRVTLAGGDLPSFAPLGPDTFVYVMPSLSGATASWEVRPPGAYYTVRAWRPEEGALDLLVVLHDAPGVVSGWARACRPGDRVALWGPRDGFAPAADTAWYLLVADDTGLPAVAAILEARPPATSAVVVAEIEEPRQRLDLPEGGGVDITWVHRRGRRTPELLRDALRELSLPDGPAYAWAGAEHAAVGAVRRYLDVELGITPDRRSLASYWRAR
jgi:NADPH-dependent ferric siderophore reductase